MDFLIRDFNVSYKLSCGAGMIFEITNKNAFYTEFMSTDGRANPFIRRPSALNNVRSRSNFCKNIFFY